MAARRLWRRGLSFLKGDNHAGVPRSGGDERNTLIVPPADEDHLVDQHTVEVVERGASVVLKKLALFVPAIFLFILAIQLMKAGAAAVGTVDQGEFPFANGVSTLGTGGSARTPCCRAPRSRRARSASSAQGRSPKLQTFTMLSGSRLGASFIVLLDRLPVRDA